MKNIFTRHPQHVGETYFQHMKCALKFSGRLFLASVGCCIHAFFPFIFQKTASRTIEKMMVNLRIREADKRCKYQEKPLNSEIIR